MMNLLAEAASFWEVSKWLPEYFQLVRDPAHIALELTLMAIFDGIVFGLIWRALRNYISNHHTKDVAQLIEAEHDYHEFSTDNLVDLDKRIRHLEKSLNNWQNQKGKV